MVTYTPLYRTAFYERAAERAWFTFPMLSANVRTFVVTAISGEASKRRYR
jgi:hypothetical protein